MLDGSRRRCVPVREPRRRNYQGDLGRFSSGEFRGQFGVGYVHGPWALEVSGAAYIPGFLYIDCYGEECLAAQAPSAGLAVANLDVRRAWRVVRSWSTRKVGNARRAWRVAPAIPRAIGIDLVLHGGPRWVTGQDALEGYAGPGLGGGATFDLNLRIVSMYLDLGMDLTLMRGADGDLLTGKLPYIATGVRLGWM